jgi:hypothetical protein
MEVDPDEVSLAVLVSLPELELERAPGAVTPNCWDWARIPLLLERKLI